MHLETFTGADLRLVFDEARRSMGEDVLVLRTAIHRDDGRTRVELVAASAETMAALQRRVDPPPPSLPKAEGGRGRSGPFVLAVVGPTGSGKTTTATKLALHPRVFGAKRVGLLTLDTFRVGAIEQMAQYADVTGLPLEVVYDAREVPQALARLEECEVVVIDTPGRSPRAKDANTQWQQMLLAAAPDEVHLVLPATVRADTIPTLLTTFRACKLTHACLTKLDELHDDRAVAEVATSVDLAIRWVATGQTVPDDLLGAKGAILSALGIATGRRRGVAA